MLGSFISKDQTEVTRVPFPFSLELLFDLPGNSD